MYAVCQERKIDTHAIMGNQFFLQRQLFHTQHKRGAHKLQVFFLPDVLDKELSESTGGIPQIL